MVKLVVRWIAEPERLSCGRRPSSATGLIRPCPCFASKLAAGSDRRRACLTRGARSACGLSAGSMIAMPPWRYLFPISMTGQRP